MTLTHPPTPPQGCNWSRQQLVRSAWLTDGNSPNWPDQNLHWRFPVSCPEKKRKQTNKREDAEQLSSSPDDLFCIEGSAFWFAMKGLDLLLLSWCLCSLNTLGGKAQVDTICPCNTGWSDYVILYKAKLGTHRKIPDQQWEPTRNITGIEASCVYGNVKGKQYW